MQDVVLKGVEHFYNDLEKNELLVKARAAQFDWKVAAEKYVEVYRKTL